MLRVPTAGDRPGPLVVPLGRATAEEMKLAAIPSQNKKRKRKSRHGKDHAWDADAHESRRRSGREDKRQMFWMLMGGATLFAAIVIVVVVAMRGGDDPVVPLAGAGALVGDAPPAAGKVMVDAAIQMSDLEFLAVAEPMAESFLSNSAVDEMLPLVLNPQLTGPRMAKFYPGGRITPVGLSAFNTFLQVDRQGTALSVMVRTKDFDEKRLHYVPTAEGLRIDWESWVGWSEMPWEEFMDTRPSDPKLFRVKLTAIEYYNMAFADDRKWQSFHLVAPDGMLSLYGYVERDSVISARLKPPTDTPEMFMTLMLRFPENGLSREQVIIDRIVADGWVVEGEGDQ